MKILLTGFKPFGTVKVNPSEQIVRAIAGRAQSRPPTRLKSRGDDLIAEILPTEYARAERAIRGLIRRHSPDAVVCLGVAQLRRAISLERVALNLDDEPSPDNAGRVRLGRPIVRDGPLAISSTLPLQRMQRALRRAGVRASFSNHAGTYVCNHVFYAARHEVERLGKNTPCGLIHVPGLREPKKNPKGMTLAKMVAGVECCLKALR